MKLTIIDDHDLFRNAMVSLLTEMYPDDEISEGNDSRESLQNILSNKVDIVLLDVQMPRINGVEFLKVIVASRPETKILMLTQLDDASLISHCIQLGANGFLFKNANRQEVQLAIRSVLETGEFYNKTVFDSLRRTLRRSGLADLKINPVEVKILGLLKDGSNTREISKKLNLTERTVDSYRRDLMIKTKVNNVAELISFGYRCGLLFPAQSGMASSAGAGVEIKNEGYSHRQQSDYSQ